MSIKKCAGFVTRLKLRKKINFSMCGKTNNGTQKTKYKF